MATQPQSRILVIESERTLGEQTVITSNRMPKLRVDAPGGMEDEPDANQREITNSQVFFYTLSSASLPRLRRLREGDFLPNFIVIENWEGGNVDTNDKETPTELRVFRNAAGAWAAEFQWSLSDLRWRAHWERRYLRQTQLLKPLHIAIAGEQRTIKRPSRISVNDHHLPGLQHLSALLSLSAGDYEAKAPLLNIEGGGTAKPSQAELRTIIEAEAADHKLAHEKSAATEAAIEAVYAGATKDIDETDNDEVATRNGFIRVLRSFDTRRYWDGAPYRRQATPQLRFPVVQTKPAST